MQLPARRPICRSLLSRRLNKPNTVGADLQLPTRRSICRSLLSRRLYHSYDHYVLLLSVRRLSETRLLGHLGPRRACGHVVSSSGRNLRRHRVARVGSGRRTRRRDNHPLILLLCFAGIKTERAPRRAASPRSAFDRPRPASVLPASKQSARLFVSEARPRIPILSRSLIFLYDREPITYDRGPGHVRPRQRAPREPVRHVQNFATVSDRAISDTCGEPGRFGLLRSADRKNP